ncbi:TetR/AcrR family transcriptional regulator [Deinococcus roseus]|uniref:TetR family transcriptional regulator n=1 Tax=Deinococcus roseus TaxID=392414 RepID=A0ABQ2D0Y5_9DEIO|nr:TetR family transcriptional regulator [Deinococcus roseus]GGJ35814.1 TetR family transcriptional regulator [Deinococcus roseus]
MARWGSNARGRLEEAAMELYLERGFEQTTVAEIAAKAGLTERTFFRHFADKREVLFGGSPVLQEVIVKTVLEAPEGTSPLEMVMAGLEAAGIFFQERRDRSKLRQTIIDAHPELQARELSKMAVLSAATAGALKQRGLADPLATLTAETGILVFKMAFERWIREHDPHVWTQLVRDTLSDLQKVLVKPAVQPPGL